MAARKQFCHIPHICMQTVRVHVHNTCQTQREMFVGHLGSSLCNQGFIAAVVSASVARAHPASHLESGVPEEEQNTEYEPFSQSLGRQGAIRTIKGQTESGTKSSRTLSLKCKVIRFHWLTCGSFSTSVPYRNTELSLHTGHWKAQPVVCARGWHSSTSRGKKTCNSKIQKKTINK